MRNLRLAIAMDRARYIANAAGIHAGRLSPEETGAGALLARWLPASRPYAAAQALIVASGSVSPDMAARASGLAYYTSSDPDRAVAVFKTIQRKTANDWNDLAAAEIERGRQSDDPESWISALAAVERALALDPQSKAALYNRTAVAEYLGLAPIAPQYWRTFLVAEPESVWAARVRRYRSLIVRSQPPDFFGLPFSQLAAAAANFPQQARAAGEGTLLIAWAKEPSPAAANLYLDRARVIATELREKKAESLLSETIASIERGNHAPSIRSAFLTYELGRLALRDEDFATAEHQLRLASAMFAAIENPMAVTAEVHMAIAIRNQARTGEALNIFSQLLASERASGGNHKGLMGRIQHEIALCEAERGRWTSSLNAARQAMDLFAGLGETGNAAAAEAIVSDNYDSLGQSDLAWRHGLSALRGASAARNVARARVIVASLTRIEMRKRNWNGAEALFGIERRLGTLARSNRVDAGMFVRAATIAAHRGERAAADRAIDSARSAAALLADDALRAKILADIDGAAGAITRKTNPARSVALLSSAIRFQQRSGRPMHLPELHLERGRAHVARGAWSAAERDFDDGIHELERQRMTVSDAEVRPGLFDNAAELFHDAVDLHLRQGANPSTILTYVERGRARALLEQMAANEPAPALPPIPTVAAVQQELSLGSVLLEYIVLRDRIAILVITPTDIRLRLVSASLADLDAAAGDWTALHRVLIDPVAGDLHGMSAIAVVADDALQRVPFAALRDPRSSSYLVERYVIAIAPSAGAFTLTAKRLRSVTRRKPRTALVVANPDIPRDAFPTLPILAASEREAWIVGGIYPTRTLLVRQDATAEQFLALAPAHDVVHFAGHAVVRRHEPGESALICASTPNVRGALTSRQIAKMRFRSTSVMVLAACSTMTGRNAAIEGVPSLARAFVIAGVPAVIGTLWDIDDAEAAPIMHELHVRLAEGVPAAQALRSAQTAAIRAGLPVRRWAAFALTGVVY